MKRSNEYELRKYANDIDALCGIREIMFNDGPNRGLRAFEVRNGKNLEVTFLADRALDIPEIRYKGINMSLTNKVGIRSANLYQEDGGSGFLKQFNGGSLTTCGITYSGAAGEDNGKQLGLHGPIDNTPAQQVGAYVDYEGDERVLKVRGQVHEAEVFATDMLLKRDFTVNTERDIVRIHDTVINQSFETQPVMMIYHVNFGYPMLNEGDKCYFGSSKVSPRNDFAAQGIDKYALMEAPGCGRDEQCYYHTEQPEDGEGFAMVVNEKLGIAGIVRFDAKALPIMCEWKCMRAGEYALGLEPTTSGVLNRSEARANGTLTYLGAGESREFNVSIEITDDAELIAAYKAKAKA